MASIARTPPLPAPGDAAGLRERARGALLGLAVGDALGAPAENLRPSEIRARWGRITGYVSDRPHGTDDTEYALFSGLLLARHGSALTPAHVEAAWHEWIADRAEGPFRGAGFSERGTLENLRRGLAAPISAQHRHAWSDGLAMRAAPYGVFAAGRPGEAARLVAIDGSVSHEGEGIYGGQAVAAGVAAAMAGAPAPVVVASALAVIPEDSWTARSLRRAVAVAHRGERAVRSAVVIGGYPWTDLAPEAVALAFGAYATADGDFKEAVLTAVNMGRDADTTAAVAGALAGATQGFCAIPPAWAAAIGPARGRCLPAMAGHHVLDIAELLVPEEGGKWGADVVLPDFLPKGVRGDLGEAGRGCLPEEAPGAAPRPGADLPLTPVGGRTPARDELVLAPGAGQEPVPDERCPTPEAAQEPVPDEHALTPGTGHTSVPPDVPALAPEPGQAPAPGKSAPAADRHTAPDESAPAAERHRAPVLEAGGGPVPEAGGGPAVEANDGPAPEVGGGPVPETRGGPAPAGPPAPSPPAPARRTADAGSKGPSPLVGAGNAGAPDGEGRS
jgi:ADP-ribosylglycohydrolase